MFVRTFSPPNEMIQEARDGAQSILKPSPRDLERGFRLRAESLVFESHGFAPRAALDGSKFAAVAEGGASETELTDLREEMMMMRWATGA